MRVYRGARRPHVGVIVRIVVVLMLGLSAGAPTVAHAGSPDHAHWSQTATAP